MGLRVAFRCGSSIPGYFYQHMQQCIWKIYHEHTGTGEAVLRKSSPSAFWGTPLAGHLNYLGVDTLITAGESTSGCVRASVVDGCTYRYRMIVVEEGVFDRHEAAHAINLFDMHQKYADVVPLSEVLEYLSAWRARQAWEQPVNVK
jgi:nicotinamidase-related amidase